ncbi:MAG: hypothetical protein OFPII_40880 [Osedax symbiont Rs1]|nr:MAG: hypothetical protein OFPII_40880 [Osedax symbiont Rs1]
MGIFLTAVESIACDMWRNKVTDSGNSERHHLLALYNSRDLSKNIPLQSPLLSLTQLFVLPSVYRFIHWID